jgi:ectoine hydroxylase-related dioxygenase (phytanoyl-CoA dioxygenase family)
MVILNLSVYMFVLVTGGLVYFHYNIAPTLVFNPKDMGYFITKYGPPSTFDLDDLVIKETFTKQSALSVALTHGSAVIRNVLSEKTTRELREFVVETNKEEAQQIYVHDKESRAHIILGHHEVTVASMLKEVAEHPILRPLLDGLLGPHSSLLAMSAVTNFYGAETQNWHSDVDVSSRLYSKDNFVPEYIVAIALQDTTKDMGATGICPGTHLFEWPTLEEKDETKWETEWRLNPDPEYSSFREWMEYKIPFCPLRALLDANDAFIYNTDLKHRGEAHIDPEADDRVVIFLTFAGSRISRDDARKLPLGNVYALNWDGWGHTIDDLSNALEWRPWQAFGLFNGMFSGVRPWTMMDQIYGIWSREDENLAFSIGEFFTSEYVEEKTWECVEIVKKLVTCQVAATYMVTLGIYY